MSKQSSLPRIPSPLILFAIILAVGSTAGRSLAATTDETFRKASSYFGGVDRIACSEIDDLKTDLTEAAAACTMIEADCPRADQALRRLFGDLHRRDLPDFVIYLDHDQPDDPLEPRLTLLMWKGKVTPYLFGSRHVWAVVFSPKPLPLDAQITTVVKRESNPFTALQALVSLSPPAPEAKAPVSETKQVYWNPVARDWSPEADTCQFWIGWARLGIELDSVNRLTVSIRQPTHTLTVTETPAKESRTETAETKTTVTQTKSPGASSSESSIVTKTKENLDPEKCTDSDVKPCSTRETTTTEKKGSDSDTEKTETVTVDPQVKITRTAGTTTNERQRKMEGPYPVTVQPPLDNDTAFGALSAHFSNSRRTRAGFGIGLGVTDNVNDTALGQVAGDATVGTTDTAVNAYALAKAYLRKPRLRVGRKRPGWRPSIAFVAGTNVGENTFEELVFGLSLGHVFGNVGIVAGVNRVRPRAGDSGRKTKPFLAVEYSF